LTHYFERQRFALWSELLILVPIAIAGFNAWQTRNTDATSLIFFYVLSGFSALAYICLYWMFTEVDRSEIRVIFGFFPVYCWTASLRDILKAEVVQNNAVQEFGGWGIRGFPTSSLCTRGNQGVLITLKNGRKMLVGSQHPDQLLRALNLPNATAPISTSSSEY